MNRHIASRSSLGRCGKRANAAGAGSSDCTQFRNGDRAQVGLFIVLDGIMGPGVLAPHVADEARFVAS